MIRTYAALAGTVALLAIAVVACGQGQDFGSRNVPKAKQIGHASVATFGDHVVHFNAQPTTMLTADVARAFAIRRSRKRAMLNVTVMHQDAGRAGVPVSADVMVRANNLLGQGKKVRLRELREAEAIYYIGEMAVANEEIVTFNVSVRPEGVDAPYEFSFRQQFYAD
jgi:hypothetical protein